MQTDKKVRQEESISLFNAYISEYIIFLYRENVMVL